MAKKILISPLDWGLGHATRCIPVINELLKRGVDVIVAADRKPLELLKNEFPQLTFEVLPGYDVKYQNKGSFFFKVLVKVPYILKMIRKEHQLLEKIIKKHKIDAVISDNRYGLWTKKVPCVFITHQIRILSPVLEELVYHLNLSYINRFNYCWIPDTSSEKNLSGNLSHLEDLPKHASFIGPLTRFKGNLNFDKTYEVMAIVSGPEPQRSIFENKLKEQLLNLNVKALLVLGKPDENNQPIQIDNLIIVSHLNSIEMEQAVAGSEVIVCRGGYSTIMDLAAYGKKAVFIPTPGQTEQEYLAKRYAGKGWCVYQKQSEMNFESALGRSLFISGVPLIKQKDELAAAVDALLKAIE
jgi:uncharacterized protein (TIGR00661 family)